MINIVLAAGYATRLYPLTENTPKPLLEIGGSTLLDRLINDIDKISDITEHVIVSNHKFIKQFEEWKDKSRYTKPITIIALVRNKKKAEEKFKSKKYKELE